MSSEGVSTNLTNTSLSTSDESALINKTEQLTKNVSFVIDIDGNTPWHRAVNNPHCTLDDVKQFAKFTWLINYPNSLDQTPLHCAVISNAQKMDVIGFLIDNGAYINAQDCNGSIPLHKALQNPQCTLQLVDLLINEGSNLLAQQFHKETPFMVAIKYHIKNTEILKKLIYERCMDICADSSRSQTTLQILSNNPSLICTVLHLASSVKLENQESLLDYLNDLSCSYASFLDDDNEEEEEEENDLISFPTALLLHAVQNPFYNIEVIKDLLGQGADIYAYDCQKRCALDYALSNPNCTGSMIWEMLRNTEWHPYKLSDMKKSFLHIAVMNRKCPSTVFKMFSAGTVIGHLGALNEESMTFFECAVDLSRGTDCNLDVIETIIQINYLTCGRATCVQNIFCQIASPSERNFIKSPPSIEKDLWFKPSPVIEKNLEILASPAGNREALEVMKLLFKYGLIEISPRTTIKNYEYLLYLMEPYLKRDKSGYFNELNSYLNTCFSEIMLVSMKKINDDTCDEIIFQFNNYCGVSENYFDPLHDKLFEFILSNLCPIYNCYLVSHLTKKYLANKLFEVNIYAPKAIVKNIILNDYCVNHITQFLEKKDLVNLYVAYADKDIVQKHRDAGQKWLYKIDGIDWETGLEITAESKKFDVRKLKAVDESKKNPKKKLKVK